MKEYRFNKGYSKHNKPIITDSGLLLITIGALIVGVLVLGTMVYLLLFQRTLESIGAHVFGLLILGVVVYRINVFMNLVDSVIIENDTILINSSVDDKLISLSDLVDFDVIRRGPVFVPRMVITYKDTSELGKLNYYVNTWLWGKSNDRKLYELEDEMNSIVSKNLDRWQK